MEEYRKIYQKWLDTDAIDAATRAELEAIANDETALKERFSAFMEFGTGGLRSKMGAGIGMMNPYTVAHATEALARTIEAYGESAKKRGVIVGFDSRNHSEEYAHRCAEVLTAHDIPVYLFDELRPTPMLSAGVRYFGCMAGINITASHNPAIYNGYKLYWEDGAQPAGEIATKVADTMKVLDLFNDVPAPALAKKELITLVGRDFDEVFMAKVMNEQVYPDVIKKAADDLEVIYTPLCGAGYRIVPEVLKRIGVKHLTVVPAQSKPNGNFPGLEKPNPEYPAAFREGIAIAATVPSDLIIANDPDCDRVGVMARDRDGEFKCITGNQMGSLLLDYIFTALEEQNKMPADAYAIKTIVSSEMATAICRKHNVDLFNVLTGFKYISEAIKAQEDKKIGTFMLGYEESYGYMKGSYSRDKDGVVASMLICEMAAYYSLKGMTLLDAVHSLYDKYGFYMEYSAEIYRTGLDGKQEISAMMDLLRNKEPKEMAGSRVVNIRDYIAETSKNILTGEVTGTGLPKSNVIYWACENGCVIVARPSGTEPKIKFYILANGADEASAQQNTVACTNALEDLLSLPHGSLKK